MNLSLCQLNECEQALVDGVLIVGTTCLQMTSQEQALLTHLQHVQICNNITMSLYDLELAILKVLSC